MKKKLTQTRLKEVFHYDKGSGILTNKIPRGRWGRSKVGDVAGCKNRDGYSVVRFDGRLYYIHILSWLYVYGFLPENQIDHIDRNKSNNSINNLREVSQMCNNRNTGTQNRNISGVKGVVWYKPSLKWRANIVVNYRSINLGHYVDFIEAVCARLAAEQCLDWSGCDSSSPAFKYVRNMLK